MSALLGTTVTASTDEHFRCKYTVGNGWLETKLLDISLKITRDIYEYDRVHGKPVPGVGDQAYLLGASLVARRGDVVVSVDGSNLPPDAALGEAPGDWACTRDNFTGLVWEVKTDDGGLRDKDWLYTWYYADPSDNGGDPGVLGGDTCGGTLGTECNSDAYAAAVNGIALCGFDNWRLPVGDELVGLVHYGIVAKPGAGTPATIDGDYFPNTLTFYYWTASTVAREPRDAWLVDFDIGDSYHVRKPMFVLDAFYPTRLVRGVPF